MNKDELLSYRKDVLKEIETTKGKLERLNEIRNNLKKEETPVIENRQIFIGTCLKFINGEIKENKVKQDLVNLNSKADKQTELETILADLGRMQGDLQRQLQEQNEILKSIERQLWKLIFDNLRAELHTQSKNLVKKLFIAAHNANLGCDFNFLFRDIFGKWQTGPSIEEKGIIEKEVKESWK
jgi:hypothetical protein